MTDLEVMRNPDKWLNWPVLPLRNPTERDKYGFPRLALLFQAGLAYQYLVFVDKSINDGVDLSQYTKSGDDSLLEELVNAGWVVDSWLITSQNQLKSHKVDS